MVERSVSIETRRSSAISIAPWQRLAVPDPLGSGIKRTTAILEIDLTAIDTNYRVMKKLIAPGVRLAAVVKSDAYGLGLIPVGQTLAEAGCHDFFVANLNEAVQLRSALPRAAIVVLNEDLAPSLNIYRRHELIAVANSLQDVDILSGQDDAIPYFLHIDTGMTRLGLTLEEVEHRHRDGNLNLSSLAGIMSHLACSESARDPLNEFQWRRFKSIHDVFPRTCSSLCASAGVWIGSKYHFDMVRVGSALYGLNNAHILPNPLRPVVRLMARIIDIRNVPAGATVGYGASFRTERRSKIAIAAIGYAQGLPWTTLNKIHAYFDTFSAPVIGRISMEFIAIDVTGLPEAICGPGASAELLNERFGPDDMALAAGTVGQEILLRFGANCPRRYVTKLGMKLP